jgi:hypothetical protein
MSLSKEISPKDAAYERKTLSNGKPNPRYVDLLEEDKAIAGQKFVCVSFVSPENILKQKEIFFFEQFLKKWEFNKSMEKFVQFLNFVSFKYNLSFDDLSVDFKGFVDEEKQNLYSNISDDYKTFLDKNETELETQFQQTNQFQTCTRGLKIRGSYSTQEEAEMRAKMLREQDPNHDVFVGPVGMWMPWDPEAYKTGRVEYMEDELNQLMKEKKTNESNAKTEFEQRLKETKRKAIEENIKNAEKTGSKLTQSVDEKGNLFGVKDALFEDGNISTADVRKELLDDVVTDKNSDHGQSLLKSGPFAKR